MKLRILIAGLITGLFWGLVALAAESGAELFQKAVTQERAGKLDEAIKLYAKVAHDFASDRALAAKALVAAARDYEKLGQDKQGQAVKLYEQVASEFADQREQATAARTKLAALRQPPPPTTTTMRKIEPLDYDTSGPFPFSTDGRRAIYRDASAKALVMSDLDGRNKRVIYQAKPGESFLFQPSRDFAMVWLRLSGPGGKVAHAVMRTDGSGYRELFQGDPYGTILPQPEWSWDNRSLVFSQFPGGGVAVVSVSDGKGREVLRRDGDVLLSPARLSPDGRFLAFIERKSLETNGRVLVVPAQGGEPRVVFEGVSQPAAGVDWTPDGRYLAIPSGRSGTEALYLLPVKDGQPSGEPVLVRYGVLLYGTMHPNGSLTFASLRTGSSETAVLAALDSSGRLGAWRPLDLNVAGNGVVGEMQWSPDSTRIVYPSRHDDAGQRGGTVRVRDIATGEDREVYHGKGPGTCYWEARPENLVCFDVQAATEEISSVALDSGRVERLGTVPASRDPLVEVEQVLREKGVEWVFPDYRARTALVRRVNNNLEFRPTKDSDWKQVATTSPAFRDLPMYSSHGIFYLNKDSVGKDAVFRVPLGGGQPERLGDAPQGNWFARVIHVSPDGSKVLVEGMSGPDSWVLENFVPKAPAAR